MAQGTHPFIGSPLSNSDRRSTANTLLIQLNQPTVVGPLSNYRDLVDAVARAAGQPLSFYKTPVDPSGTTAAINALIKVIDGD